MSLNPSPMQIQLANEDVVNALVALKNLKSFLSVHGSIDGEETITEAIRVIRVVSEIELKFNPLDEFGV